MPLDLAYAVGSGVTITATEKSLTVTGGADGVFARIDIGLYSLWADGIGTLVKGDEFKWRVYEKARTGGTQRVWLSGLIHGDQSEGLLIPTIMLGIGWDMTLQRVSATSRAFDWSIRRLAS